MDPLGMGGVRIENKGYYNDVPNSVFIIPVLKNMKPFQNIHFLPRVFFSLTCPEGSSLPVMVVMGEASQPRHAAGVVVLEPLEEFA